MMIIHKSEEEELTLEHALDKLGHTSNFDVHGEVISLLADLCTIHEFKDRTNKWLDVQLKYFYSFPPSPHPSLLCPAPMLCLGITPSNETNQ